MILSLWCSDVKKLFPFDKSQIFNDLSAEPEAKKPLFAWFKDRDITESVWLPSLYFLDLFENTFGFFLLRVISPPKIKSGWIASVRSRFQIYICGRKEETIAKLPFTCSFELSEPKATFIQAIERGKAESIISWWMYRLFFSCS